MRRERIGSLIPLTSIAVCSLLVAFSPAGISCFPMLWRCYEHSLLFQALVAAALLPLLAGVPGGLYAGIRQAMRTYRVVKQLQTLPQTEQPLSITRLAHTLHITDQVDLIDDFRLEAFCYGFLKPRICLTTGLLRALTDAEVESVLHHEYQHLKRRDPLRALFWTVVDKACWWQEKSGELAQLHRELAADRYRLVCQVPIWRRSCSFYAQSAALPLAWWTLLVRERGITFGCRRRRITPVPASRAQLRSRPAHATTQRKGHAERPTELVVALFSSYGSSPAVPQNLTGPHQVMRSGQR